MSHARVFDVAILRRGAHENPHRGACLVELASSLPGAFWTDHPADIDPVVAATARVVNDATSDDRRRMLVSFAPWLTTSTTADSAEIANLVAGLANRSVLDAADASAAEWRAAVALHADPSQPARWLSLEHVRQRRRAVRSVRLAAKVLRRSSEADDALVHLLLDVVNLRRELDHLPVLSPPSPEISYPPTLPVRVELRAVDCAEFVSFHCTALTDEWPEHLVDAWHARNREMLHLEAEAATPLVAGLSR